MDSLSAALALQLQLNDIRELQNAQKGKHLEGDIPDANHALLLYAEELARAQMLIDDRRMGCSISQAVQADADMINSVRGEEDSAFRDRQVACSLGGLSRPPRPEGEDFLQIDPTDKLVQQLTPLNAFEDQSDDLETDTDTVGESSSTRPPKASPRRVTKQLCTACQEPAPFFNILQAPCGHHYCRPCIAALFSAATSDESLFPPRCCRQPIPLPSATPFLPPDLVRTFTAKAVEFSTPNRTYCYRETCSAFIPPVRVLGDIGTCPSCQHQTCTLCKQDAHAGDCPQDTALQALVALAAANGWMRCYACARMVELGVGCNHMTCLCSAQFCYACGLRWKTCGCEQWDEARLLARATDVVQRDARPRVAAVEAQRVREAVEHLRDRHECGHEGWRYVQGEHACEECGHNLPRYIFECRQCRLQACNRCRRNRL